ncbi:CsgG/HfaB family protein [Hydrogenovibrio kuenenii]|uniref:CsgG/HfaB family protein n=1 Tax=Hydrogenovibrio kuenenii TaxID=63658 RepID=UPI000464936D|nr:CsgG/HfaB family protein [Hydrogenovibrio kuenenii]
MKIQTKPHSCFLCALKLKALSFFIATLAIAELSGCATTTRIQYLEPAQVEQAAKYKRVAVNAFKNDSVGLGGKIETKLSQKNLENKAYFTVLNRQDFDKILKEQKLQYSGLTNEKDVVKVGELIGAQAFITGEVTSTSSQDSRYLAERYECLDKKCDKMRTYVVPCRKRTVSMSANVKIIDIQTSSVVYSNSYTPAGHWSTCVDQARSLPSAETVWQRQANQIAADFVSKLAPHYVYKNIELLDDPDINYNDNEKQLLKGGIAFVEAHRMDKADQLFSQLVFQTQSLSYVAAYNLGVVKEATGDYDEAKKLYTLADNLQKEPVDAINKAMNRIKEVIAQHQKATQQIEQP